MPRPGHPSLAPYEGLAALAEQVRDLERRQQRVAADVMRRRYNRLDGLPEDHVDED